MPRSFSRMAGRPPRTSAWCMSSLGKVSSVALSAAISRILLRKRMNSCTKSVIYEGYDRQRTLDPERRSAPFSLAEIPLAETERHDPVRARLLDGGATDLRPAGAGAALFLGNGLVRRQGLRHLVR